MNKTSTRSSIPSQSTHTGNTLREVIPGMQEVKMLIRYSQALQVIQNNNFPTCYLVLN